jgi:hypothetical protein
MIKRQRRGVQEEPFLIQACVSSMAVAKIVDDRVTNAREVDTNLMGTARL